MRAEEVGASKASVSVDHIEPERWVLSWLMLTGMPSARRCTKASTETVGKKCTSRREMSRAVGVKNPQEAQKAKTLWKMKAAKDAGEEYYDPTREDKYQRKKRNKISTLGRAPQRSNCWTGQNPIVRGSYWLESFVESRLR